MFLIICYFSHTEKKFVGCTRLRELTVTYNVKPQFFSTVAKLTQLTSLSISHQCIHQDDASVILRALTQLKHLQLTLEDDNDNLSSDDDGDFMDDDELETYAEISDRCHCSRRKREADSIYFFRSLRRATQLEQLTIDFRHLVVLPEYMSTLTRLTSLSIEGYHEKGFDLVPSCFARHLSTLTNLEQLKVTQKELVKYSVDQLRQYFAPFVKLRSLFSDVKIDPGNEETLGTDLFQRLTKLDRLTLRALPIFTLPNIKYLVTGACKR